MILREDMIEQSVQDMVRSGLAGFNYDDTIVNIRDAFPTPGEREKPLTKTQLAVGFNFDDGGTPAEMGSNLTRFVHTIEFWTFAVNPRIGKQLANVIKHMLWGAQVVPLLDYNSADDPPPQIDALVVLRCQVARQVNASARPWDQFVWTTTVRIEDTYYPGV